jgi:hypothetical protein
MGLWQNVSACPSPYRLLDAGNALVTKTGRSVTAAVCLSPQAEPDAGAPRPGKNAIAAFRYRMKSAWVGSAPVPRSTAKAWLPPVLANTTCSPAGPAAGATVSVPGAATQLA